MPISDTSVDQPPAALDGWPGFGKRLAEARKLRGLNQVQLADQLGIGQSTLAKWETEDRAPNDFLATVFKCCNILGIRGAWLLFNEGPQTVGELLKEPTEIAKLIAQLEPSQREALVSIVKSMLPPSIEPGVGSPR